MHNAGGAGLTIPDGARSERACRLERPMTSNFGWLVRVGNHSLTCVLLGSFYRNAHCRMTVQGKSPKPRHPLISHRTEPLHPLDFLTGCRYRSYQRGAPATRSPTLPSRIPPAGTFPGFSMSVVDAILQDPLQMTRIATPSKE